MVIMSEGGYDGVKLVCKQLKLLQIIHHSARRMRLARIDKLWMWIACQILEYVTVKLLEFECIKCNVRGWVCSLDGKSIKVILKDKYKIRFHR